MKHLAVLALSLLVVCSSYAGGAPENGLIGEHGYEVNFVENGRFRIETGLEMPESYVPGDAPIPAVIFAPGSGGGSGFPDYVARFIDTFLREPFVERGYALIHYNKRGLGDSTGRHTWGSMESRTEDLLAIVDYYRNDPRIDGERIGAVGHSQGGWVVMMAGGRDPEIDFLISLAGPTTTLRVQDLGRTRMELECGELTAEQVDEGVAKRDRALDRMVRWGGVFPFFDLRFMHNSIDYDPAPDILNISQPALLAYGGLDSMVKPADNLDRLAEIFPEGVPEHVSVHVAPGTDHMFHVTDTTCFDYDAAQDDPYSSEFIDFYHAWVVENVIGK